MTSRGLDVEALAAKGWDTQRRGGTDALVIPYVQYGEVVNHQYRWDPTPDGRGKKHSQDKGGTKCLYNFDCLLDPTLDDEPLIITEGAFDAESAIQSGYPRTVSVPDGAPADETDSRLKFSYLLDEEDNLRPELAKIRRIYLAVDNDRAGRNLYHALRRYLGSSRCYFITFPRRSKTSGPDDRCKDLNEVLQRFGANGVQQTIKTAQPHPVDGIFKLTDLAPKDHRAGLRCHFVGLENHYQPRKGDFTVVTGIPSHGKTTVCINICFFMAFHHRWRCVLALFETELETEFRRHLFALYRSEAATATDEEMLEWIDKHFIFIVPKDLEDPTLDWLTERLEAAILRIGADLALVDPWNEIDHVREPGEHMSDYTGRAIKRFKRMARFFETHFIITAHPTKDIIMGRGNSQSIRKPTLYDIEGSRHWYGKADVGIIVHRDFQQHTTEIDVAKVRYQGTIGKPGAVTLQYNSQSYRYEKVSTDKQPEPEQTGLWGGDPLNN